MMKISFIGAGNMASAIIESIVRSGRFSPDSIYIFDKISDKASRFENLGAFVCSSLSEVCEK